MSKRKCATCCNNAEKRFKKGRENTYFCSRECQKKDLERLQLTHKYLTVGAWNLRSTANLEPSMDELRSLRRFCIFSTFDGQFVYGLPRENVDTIPYAKRLLITFMRTQLESTGDVDYMFGRLDFVEFYHAVRSQLCEKYGTEYSEWEKKQSMTAKCLFYDFKKKRDLIYEPFNRLLDCTKFNRAKDGYGKYKFRTGSIWGSNPFVAVNSYFDFYSGTDEEIIEECDRVYAFNFKTTTEKMTTKEIEPLNWKSVKIDSIDKSHFRDMQNYLLFSAIDGKIIYGLPRSVLKNVDAKRLLGKFFGADRKMHRYVKFSRLVLNFSSCYQLDNEAGKLKFGDAFASEPSRVRLSEYIKSKMKEIMDVRNAWRDAFSSLLAKCHFVDSLGEKSFL